jgi:hypothetical protein
MTLKEALATDAVRRADDGAGAALEVLDHPWPDCLEIVGEVEFRVGIGLRPQWFVGL